MAPLRTPIMPNDFQFDDFLSHSSKDKVVVHDIAERLKQDEAPLACPAAASPRRWKSGTFWFRDLLNKERRFLTLRLDDAPIKGSLAQLHYINWHPTHHSEALEQP